MLTECLIGCQSDDCLSKTCCSTNDLHSIVFDNDIDNPKTVKPDKSADASKKSTSMVSLNASSLIKLRQSTGATIQSVIRKSVSESRVSDGIGRHTTLVSNQSSTVSELSIPSIEEDEQQTDKLSASNITPNSDNGKLSTPLQNTRHTEETSLLNGQKTDADKQFTSELRTEIEEQIRRT